MLNALFEGIYGSNPYKSPTDMGVNLSLIHISQTMIQKNDIKVENHLMTPEALWAMGRIGGAEASPNGKQVVFYLDVIFLNHSLCISSCAHRESRSS